MYQICPEALLENVSPHPLALTMYIKVNTKLFEEAA
jgi:hypothetical protein